MSPSSYRLHDGTNTVARGPLALLASQAHKSAIAGRHLAISDPEGNTVTVTRSHHGIRPIWQQPQQLFPPDTIANQPVWFDRLARVIAQLDDQQVLNIQTNNQKAHT